DMARVVRPLVESARASTDETLQAPRVGVGGISGWWAKPARAPEGVAILHPPSSWWLVQLGSSRSVPQLRRLCGAAGILRDRQATTHWSAWNLLPYYGATPVRSRVVVDGNLVTAAGVTAGVDAALVV